MTRPNPLSSKGRKTTASGSKGIAGKGPILARKSIPSKGIPSKGAAPRKSLPTKGSTNMAV